jgi:3-mercaptopyruvate sulfurtransferase SseA
MEFKKMGYNHVKVVDGGLQGWQDAGLSLYRYRLEKDKEEKRDRLNLLVFLKVKISILGVDR